MTDTVLINRETLQAALDTIVNCEAGQMSHKQNAHALRLLRAAMAAPADVPHTLAGFKASFYSLHGCDATDREIWDAAIRSWRDLQGPADVVVPSVIAQGTKPETSYPAQSSGKPSTALLKKPAQVAGGIYRAGVPERYVIGAAQRYYEAREADLRLSIEQRQEDERNRRLLWDTIWGSPVDQVAEAPKPDKTDSQGDRSWTNLKHQT